MADKSTKNISLKALVNKGSNRVIFIESGHDFIDVLFSFLTIPMGTIIRLASKHSVPVGIGCINNLYASVQNIDVQHFRTEACRDMLLCPRNGAGSTLKNLKLSIDDCEPTRYFKCSNVSCCTSKARLSYYNSVRCRCGSLMDSEINLSFTGDHGLFVKGLARLIISDDLQVMPPITSVTSSLLTNLGVMDSKAIEKLTLNIGVGEVLILLMSSFVSKTPLTDILLKHRPLSKLSNNINNQQIYTKSRTVGDTRNEEEQNISLKLIVSKSKKVVCYAEAREDFVNLLFSFLIVPLGFILKELRFGSLKGCIDLLHKSVQDLDEQFLKCKYSKEVLVSPKIPPGFLYENHLLEIGTYAYHIVSAEIVDPKSDYNEGDLDQGFLKGPAMFTVTDSLVVSSISPILGLSVLSKMNVPIADIEVRTVQVGKEEALDLLVASFLCDSALTSVFLRKIKHEQ